MKRRLFAVFAVLTLASLVLVARVTRAQQSPDEPAPTVDRVGFPTDYQTTFTPYYTVDRPDNKQVRIIWANAAAASWQLGQPFDYGSILVMETWRAKLDGESNPVLDDNGRFIKDELTGVFVMRKEPGFGVDYQQLRTGEWEYVAFKPDGTYSTPPEKTFSCAKCHGDTRGEQDWTYRTQLHFGGGGAGAVPNGVINDYKFVPGTITIKAGTMVTWYNDDTPAHDIVADDGSYDSGRLLHGGSFGQKFSQPGTYAFHCSIHMAMKGTVVVQ